ncbi:MAG TPA: ATP-binding protein [Vicinamibacterales bacterium]|nr:ATP-binding protein [Vicinamibacterales bacterium]
MTTDGARVIRLQIRSTFEMLDFVQLVSDELGHMYGLEDDAVHWVGVAVRESVINAIKHGNREDLSKTVTIEFMLDAADAPSELVVRVTDQGSGFDIDGVGNPLAPENILKASGRGIFFMRSFMDDVQIRRAPEGGMEVRMVKKFGHAS